MTDYLAFTCPECDENLAAIRDEYFVSWQALMEIWKPEETDD